ncbi:MAG: accessory factor UbiK family protein, partial [Gammaproteobacteria bacterium]|nr:accessory factor UbiK family protein [Gammaproteobacteria bacterium]
PPPPPPSITPCSGHPRAPPASDLRPKIEQQLREGVAELSAIDREEFDAQVRALQRAEERIQALEETVAELESRLAAQDETSAE